MGLEIAPTIEDVFHAETTSVEDYLAQVEESTLLATIQEAQQDAITSFEGYMEQAMVRDWAANRRQLFGLIAPNVGAFGGPGPLASGPQPLIGRSTQQAGEACHARPTPDRPAPDRPTPDRPANGSVRPPARG